MADRETAGTKSPKLYPQSYPIKTSRSNQLANRETPGTKSPSSHPILANQNLPLEPIGQSRTAGHKIPFSSHSLSQSNVPFESIGQSRNCQYEIPLIVPTVLANQKLIRVHWPITKLRVQNQNHFFVPQSKPSRSPPSELIGQSGKL